MFLTNFIIKYVKKSVKVRYFGVFNNKTGGKIILKICAVVSEYNPFHNGHKYHIEKTRQLGASHIVAVMSGNTVQRGEIAILDKHYRAKKAVENGVNLVIELPCPYSCASSELFAKGAVQIIKGLGCVDMLSFGCETERTELLTKAAECSESLRDSPLVKKLVSEGENYPSAISKACGEIFGNETAQILQKPNNTLAVEYIKALKNAQLPLEICAVKRIGADHDSKDVGDSISSAGLIRERLRKGGELSQLMPYVLSENQDIFSFEEMTRAVVFKLKTMTAEELSEIPDCTAELAFRLCEYLKSDTPLSLSQLYGSVKTKNITHARIRRVILFAMLGVLKEDFCPVPYGRVLAFDNKGKEILAEAKKQGTMLFTTSLAKAAKVSLCAKRFAYLDNVSSQLQKLCGRKIKSCPSEYSVKFQKQ